MTRAILQSDVFKPTVIRTVFHPTDFSEASDVAFAHALALTLVAQATLRVFHVKAEGGQQSDAFPQVRGLLSRWSLLPVGSSRDALAQLGIRVEKTLVKGDPLRAIEKDLERRPVDLVVLATHGRQGPPRWIHGSVAEPVARRANAMTLFVPQQTLGFVQPEDGAIHIARVLIPVAASPHARPALNAAAAFALASLSTDIVHLDLTFVGDPAEMPALDVPRHPQLMWDRVTRQGNVVDELMGIVEQRSPDLIVMTTEGHRGILDALRGSTTERLLRNAGCPVLAVPAVGKPRGR